MPITRHFHRPAATFIAVCAALTFTAPAASAQDGESASERTPSTGTPPVPIPADAANEVLIDVRQIGLDKARPGEWCGFQLELNDSSSKPRDAVVRVELEDADGDTVLMQRWIVLNPGKQSTWLHAWQPFEIKSTGSYRFSVYAAEPRAGGGGSGGSGGGAEPTGLDRLRLTRRIGTRVYPLSSGKTVDPTEGLIAIVGASQAGLDQYAACRIAGTPPWSPTSHEHTETISGLKLDDLPDHWQGYLAFDALVWTGRDSGEDPRSLNASQAQAIRGWVQRGGHLVIVLPGVGQPWYDAAGAIGPLAEILPDTQAVLAEGADLEPYRALLTADNSVPLPKNAALHRFEPPTGRTPGPFDAMPILKGDAAAGGETVVVRRLVGEGAVTVIGIDLMRRDLAARDALQAQQFWNRVLGKRMKVLSPAALSNYRAGSSQKNLAPQYAFDRPVTDFDAPIARWIGKESRAAKGLLAAFALFICYWLLAGPLGFMVLKQRKKIQHAWVVFSALTAVFALVGWGASSTLKLGRDVDKHYTLLDHVYGQPHSRMRSFVELTLPKYGEQRVSVRGPDGPQPASNLLTSWESGSENSSRLASFPDARGYPVDSGSPDTTDFPARATSRQLQIDYAGSVPPGWGMIHPRAADGVELGNEVYIEEPSSDRPPGAGPERRWTIRGQVVHELPAALHDAYVFVVYGLNLREPRGDTLPAQLPAAVYSGLIPEPWEPNQVIDLDKVVDKSSVGTARFFANIRGKASTSMMGMAGSAAVRSDLPLMRMAYGQAFFSMLEPPDPGAASEVWATRESTHGWDLGRWFTQPCIIIVGILGGEGRDAAECPVPISIDAQSPQELRKNIRGVTVVRWVYPLKPNPPTPPKPDPRPRTVEDPPPTPSKPQG